MIVGSTANLPAYENQLPSILYTYLEKIKSFDFSAVDDGRIPLDGEDYMSIETHPTEPAVMRRMEGHNKYIDIHYIISGEEWIGAMARCDAAGMKESYPDKDLYFFEGVKEESRILLLPGQFAIFFPEDLHRPLCAGTGGRQTVRKVIVKAMIEGIKT